MSQLGVIGLLVALATGVGGEITAIENVVGRTYNVYERLDKLGRVFDYESICLRRTRTWRSGINADNEVGSEFKSDNIPTNYFNHAAIMQAAVEYYISTGM